MPMGWMPFVAAIDADTTLQQLRKQLQLHTGVRERTHELTMNHHGANRSTPPSKTCVAPLHPHLADT